MSVLKKEVLPPQKSNSGIGFMMVAALVLVFTMASSAALLRSHAAQEARAEAAALQEKAAAEQKAARGAELRMVIGQSRPVGAPMLVPDCDGNDAVVCEDATLKAKVLKQERLMRELQHEMETVQEAFDKADGTRHRVRARERLDTLERRYRERQKRIRIADH